MATPKHAEDAGRLADVFLVFINGVVAGGARDIAHGSLAANARDC
jgi:hypothetical protein